MNKKLAPEIALEPERYELQTPPVHHFELDRRDFAKIVGTGIAVFLLSKGAISQQQQGESGGRGGAQGAPKDISAWLHIAENGAITVFTGKVEIGQNIRTSLSQVVAEELRAPFESITMVMGDTRLTPYDAGTFGSQTTPRMGMQLRHVASVACDTLKNLAAKQWNVDAARLVPAAGKITDPQTRRSITYGQLAQGQAFETAVLADDPLIAPADWTVAGKPLRKVDGRDFVTGRHKYTSDVKLPDMLYGKVLRPESFGATDRKSTRLNSSHSLHDALPISQKSRWPRFCHRPSQIYFRREIARHALRESTPAGKFWRDRSEEHTSELQSLPTRRSSDLSEK